MWMAPPSGLRFISAFTTTSVRWSVSSRTRDDAALCPPLTARNALVTAMAIFDGSKATTAPLRRMTLYWESVGAGLPASAEPVSPVINWCCAVEDAAADGLATCIVLSPVEILYFLVSTTRPGDSVQFRHRRGPPEAGPASVGTRSAGASQGLPDFP